MRVEYNPGKGISFDMVHYIENDIMEQWWGKAIPLNKTVKLNCAFALPEQGGDKHGDRKKMDG